MLGCGMRSPSAMAEAAAEVRRRTDRPFGLNLFVQDTPTPASLDTILHHDLAGLTRHRQSLDAMIVAWAAELRDADLEHSLRYANRLGIVSERHFGSLLLHFFNHQTHHRGQAATLLTQAGVDTGVTDLLVRIPDTLRPD